jgi:hypothetical protein
MRNVKYALLGLVFALLIIGAAAPPIPFATHAGTQADPALVYNSETVSLVFDDTYTSAGVRLVRIDCELLSEAGAPVSTWSVVTGAWTVANAEVRVPVRVQAASIANGVYQLRIRVWDEFGNVSGYSNVLWVTKQWRDIAPPGGCRTVG